MFTACKPATDADWRMFLASLGAFVEFHATDGCWRSPLGYGQFDGVMTLRVDDAHLGDLRKDLRVLATSHSKFQLGLLVGESEMVRPLS